MYVSLYIQKCKYINTSVQSIYVKHVNSYKKYVYINVKKKNIL